MEQGKFTYDGIILNENMKRNISQNVRVILISIMSIPT